MEQAISIPINHKTPKKNHTCTKQQAKIETSWAKWKPQKTFALQKLRTATKQDNDHPAKQLRGTFWIQRPAAMPSEAFKPYAGRSALTNIQGAWSPLSRRAPEQAFHIMPGTWWHISTWRNSQAIQSSPDSSRRPLPARKRTPFSSYWPQNTLWSLFGRHFRSRPSSN